MSAAPAAPRIDLGSAEEQLALIRALTQARKARNAVARRAATLKKRDENLAALRRASEANGSESREHVEWLKARMFTESARLRVKEAAIVARITSGDGDQAAAAAELAAVVREKDIKKRSLRLDVEEIHDIEHRIHRRESEARRAAWRARTDACAREALGRLDHPRSRSPFRAPVPAPAAAGGGGAILREQVPEPKAQAPPLDLDAATLDTVKCAICIDIMVRPVSFKACNHLVCAHCWDQWVMQAKSVHLKCAQCNAAVYVPPTFNPVVAGMVDQIALRDATEAQRVDRAERVKWAAAVAMRRQENARAAGGPLHWALSQ